MGTRQTNAAAGVGARNGVNRNGIGKEAGHNDTANRPIPASHLVVLIDRNGHVSGIFADRAAVRSLLRGGVA